MVLKILFGYILTKKIKRTSGIFFFLYFCLFFSLLIFCPYQKHQVIPLCLLSVPLFVWLLVFNNYLRTPLTCLTSLCLITPPENNRTDAFRKDSSGLSFVRCIPQILISLRKVLLLYRTRFWDPNLTLPRASVSPVTSTSYHLYSYPSIFPRSGVSGLSGTSSQIYNRNLIVF